MDVILQLNKLYRKLWIKFGLIWSCTLQKGVTLHLHKVESSSPTDALYHVCSDLRLCRRRFENLVDACVFLLYCIVVLPLRRKECGFPFKQNKVLFASECYNMLIVDEIRQVVFEKIHFATNLFSPLLRKLRRLFFKQN